jgi:pyruvate formate lyase activating enzyme
MRIGGFIDISTNDIPNITSMVIFTVGCNLNCQFCHNKYLHHLSVGKNMEIDEIIKAVKSNQLVNGISITGGEPTLQKDILELCRGINNLGKFISIDTNGTNPHIIKDLLNYVNRIALDIKAPLNKEQYQKICNQKINPEQIKKSFHHINDSEVDFEVRTTYVEGLMNASDIHKIISFLKKAKFRGNFVLQQYQYSEGVGEEYKETFHKPEHGTLLKILKKYKDSKFSFNIFLRDDVIGYKRITNLYDPSLDDILKNF